MRRLLTLALGAAIGYVLGARAGRERYDQIAAMARRLVRGERSPSTTLWADDRMSGGMDASGSSMSTSSAPTFGEPFESSAGH